MKRIGIVSYNIYGNFTNYGSALQSWALCQAIKQLGRYEPILVDYCPDIHIDKEILNPLKKMWDQDKESVRNCQMTLPSIKVNYYKFEDFFWRYFLRTQKKYTSNNFNEVVDDENIDGFVCGSDTIFCIEESNGFDDGFFANYACMKACSVAYAASFGDAQIKEDEFKILNERLNNFKAIGLREQKMLGYLEDNLDIPVARTIDPTLLLPPEMYIDITAERIEPDKYLLLYSRRYNPEMESYAECIAKQYGWKIVEISLRATNAEKGHRMFYEAGVEEFLSLVKHAEYVVTNSFHGLMFSVQFKKNFAIFSRETGQSKISEALSVFGLQDHLLTTNTKSILCIDDYDKVHSNILEERQKSLDFLKMELTLIE